MRAPVHTRASVEVPDASVRGDVPRHPGRGDTAAGGSVLKRSILALLLVAPLLGSAQETAPVEEHRFGGCSKSGSICGDPAVSVSLVGYDLSSKTLQRGLSAGAGYELSVASNTWHRIGF